MSKKTKKTLSSVMDARRKSIQSKSRMLVECILAKDPLTANKIFPGLVTESQNLRELEVQKLIMEDDEDWGDESTDDSSDESTDDWGDESTDDGSDESTDDWGDESTDDSSDESTDESDDSSDDATAEGSDEDTNKVINDTIEIQCQINAKIIENLFNVIADLKNTLNNQDLDESSKEFIVLDTTIAYYSDKLQELQNQTNPGTDQSQLEEKLDTITKALDELKEKAGSVSNESDEISPDMTESEESSESDTEESSEASSEEENSEENTEETETSEENTEENTEETETSEENTEDEELGQEA